MPTDTKTAVVAAANTQDAGSLLTVAQFIHLIEQVYLQHVRRAEGLDQKGAKIKNRLYRARALECAAILVDYYRRIGLLSDMELWESRRRLCEALAFNHRNSIAQNIGAAVETPVIAPETDTDDDETRY